MQTVELTSKQGENIPTPDAAIEPAKKQVTASELAAYELAVQLLQDKQSKTSKLQELS